jgi:hypothetical protein
MKCEVKCAFVSAVTYSLFFGFAIHSYYTDPRSQLVFLSIVGLPADLIYFAIADASWTVSAQVAWVGLLSLLQYSVVGYFVGRFYCR